jgi:basic amino acid/polyamine antiporter, APA family
MVIGVVVYFAYSRGHSRLRRLGASPSPLPVDGADPKATT